MTALEVRSQASMQLGVVELDRVDTDRANAVRDYHVKANGRNHSKKPCANQGPSTAMRKKIEPSYTIESLVFMEIKTALLITLKAVDDRNDLRS